MSCGRNNCKDNKCERIEHAAKELACKAQKLQACIIELLEKAECLQRKADCLENKANCLREQALRFDKEAAKLDCEAEEYIKRARILSENLAELMKRTDCCFIKAVECFKEECKEDECDFDCDGCWR
ncbi:MAG: hypothetical protein ACRDCB_06435 [Clostridium sp.]|uniref:hypothetical protein n=1 Tax=Clostridium chrysemydis TaxID=2665504 RepID=UPI003EE7DF7B